MALTPCAAAIAAAATPLLPAAPLLPGVHAAEKLLPALNVDGSPDAGSCCSCCWPKLPAASCVLCNGLALLLLEVLPASAAGVPADDGASPAAAMPAADGLMAGRWWCAPDLDRGLLHSRLLLLPLSATGLTLWGGELREPGVEQQEQ
jgi:hypothetical protein